MTLPDDILEAEKALPTIERSDSRALTKLVPPSKKRRGAAPGERRGGRAKGTPNKATAEIRALAQMHGEAMLNEAVRLATQGQSEAVRLAAISLVLDRGYGKPIHPVVSESSNDAAVKIVISADDLRL
jgi:hypothetical protein